MTSFHDPLPLIIFFGLLGFAPILFILTTSFIKISIVCILTRESLGVQQIPPNVVIYSLSLILSFYIMGPVYNTVFKNITENVRTDQPITSAQIVEGYERGSAPLKTFLLKHSTIKEREFFFRSLNQFWSKEMMADVRKDDFIILIPAFVISEITQAFKIGFLIYLPSVIIDIIVSNILMSMGMMMMSPITISLPIKILLFISVDGWSRLIHLLLNSYK